jgi:pimeloyl-ACP methyl ester carboxylesterase
MGGYVAFEIMRQAPWRVENLALLSTSASPDTPERRAYRSASIGMLAAGKFAGVTRRLLPQLVHPTAVARVGARVQQMARRVGGEAFLRQQRAILARPDSRALLPAISVPTIVAVGDGDALTPPAESILMAQTIPGARFSVFRECGHLPPIEKPSEVSRLLLDWIRQA